MPKHCKENFFLFLLLILTFQQCCGSKYIQVIGSYPEIWPNLDPDPSLFKQLHYQLFAYFAHEGSFELRQWVFVSQSSFSPSFLGVWIRIRIWILFHKDTEYAGLEIISTVFSERIARFLPKNEQMSDSLKKMRDSLIRSFLVSNLSDLLTSLIFGERPERFTYIAH